MNGEEEEMGRKTEAVGKKVEFLIILIFFFLRTQVFFDVI